MFYPVGCLFTYQKGKVVIMIYFFGGCIFWGIWVFLIYVVRPNAVLSKETMETAIRRTHKKRHIIDIIIVVMVVTVLLCILPMSLSPWYNGTMPVHRDQYEVLAESILDGRLHLDDGDVDPRLLELENPYDVESRWEAGMTDFWVAWDHAFYNGHYYMYFGVVPVFLLFLPYRIITGTSLTTYHATQIFTAFFILGVFMLFFLLSKKFFRKMTVSVYLSLSAAVSIMSVWYIADAPALYCTPIAAGICMEIWSIFFFMKAVWDSNNERKSTYMGVLGSLFGALTFGCRPPIAVANILAVPMFVRYLKGKQFNLKLLKQILAVFIPYIVIGLLLMLYNYARFENPFEFGQSYQLTVMDQRTLFADRLNMTTIIEDVWNSFIGSAPLSDSFPYITFQSVLLNFPICLIAVFCLMYKGTRSALKENKLVGLTCVLLFTPVLITVTQSIGAPGIGERYRSDLYWVMGIILFILFGHFLEGMSDRHKRIWGLIISLLAFTTIFRSILFWMVPNDWNFTYELSYPEYLTVFEKVFRLGF